MYYRSYSGSPVAFSASNTKLRTYSYPGNTSLSANVDIVYIVEGEIFHQPISGIFRVVQCGLDATVRLHVLVHLRGYEGPRVLIGEGLTLTVSALRAQVCTVRHLILLQQQKQKKRMNTLEHIQIHTDLTFLLFCKRKVSRWIARQHSLEQTDLNIEGNNSNNRAWLWMELNIYKLEWIGIKISFIGWCVHVHIRGNWN